MSPILKHPPKRYAEWERTLEKRIQMVESGLPKKPRGAHTMIKHTPEPWELRYTGGYGKGGIFAGDIQVGQMHLVPLPDSQRTRGETYDFPQSEANSRLVVYAPEMLKALRKMANLYVPSLAYSAPENPLFRIDGAYLTVGDVRDASELLAEIEEDKS